MKKLFKHFLLGTLSTIGIKVLYELNKRIDWDIVTSLVPDSVSKKGYVFENKDPGMVFSKQIYLLEFGPDRDKNDPSAILQIIDFRNNVWYSGILVNTFFINDKNRGINLRNGKMHFKSTNEVIPFWYLHVPLDHDQWIAYFLDNTDDHDSEENKKEDNQDNSSNSDKDS